MKKVISLLIIFIILGGCLKENKMVTKENKETMKVKINDREVNLNWENNDTVKELLNHLPLNMEMQELNGNEKYAYLDNSLPTNSFNPEEIKTGDVYLYGNNCLVIFYQDFSTNYSYTKIGHITNLPDLGKENISLTIEK